MIWDQNDGKILVSSIAKIALYSLMALHKRLYDGSLGASSATRSVPDSLIISLIQYLNLLGQYPTSDQIPNQVPISIPYP